jgi:hypothetical protein
MHKYRVVERWADESRVALQCQMGRYHVALALNGMPPAAGTLHGQKPYPGFVVLLSTVSGTMFRMIFESINQAELFAGPNGFQTAPRILPLANRPWQAACLPSHLDH